MKKIAFIGVGVMGKAMVQNLSQAGYPVSIYTRTKNKVEDLISDKIIWHDSVAECIKDQDIVMTMVGFPQDVEEIYFSSKGIIANAKKDCILIDFTTSSPLLAKKIFEESSKHSLASLDAPVSGGDIGAKKGTLSIMVGGDENVFKQIEPVLEVLGSNINYVGSAGNGQHTKMANQIALAGALAGVCEALTYAKAVNLAPQIMLDCISSGAAGSWQMTNNAPRIIADDFAPGFYIKHYIKDMKIAKAVNDTNNLDLEVLNTVLQQFEQLQTDGFENLGTQALIKYYQR